MYKRKTKKKKDNNVGEGEGILIPGWLSTSDG